MKFKVKIATKLKDHIKDAKGEILLNTIISQNLSAPFKANVGNYFEFIFDVDKKIFKTQIQKIIDEILINSLIEEAQILSVEEI